ncbi:MAG: DUF6444 domain-containing protein [Desulfobacteraceae bacterium]|jgi:hypothetical protein|nr:DUF6444 domain-containing protein [Desulfobacteraceae bacterium]
MAPTRPFSELEWQLIPESVRQHILQLESALFGLNQRVEKLEAKAGKNSSNSSKPPSSDSPFKRPERRRKKTKRAKGRQKGHPGHQQQTQKERKQPQSVRHTVCGVKTPVPGVKFLPIVKELLKKNKLLKRYL